jgi:hypothetical protein
LEEGMKKYSKEEKLIWLADWRQSGKSAWGYAKEKGINPQTFSKWTKAGNESEAEPCFIEVSAHVLSPISSISEILIEKGDVRIHIPLSLNSNELRAVMEGLGSAL